MAKTTLVLRALAFGVVTMLVLIVLATVLGAGAGSVELALIVLLGALAGSWAYRAVNRDHRRDTAPSR